MYYYVRIDKEKIAVVIDPETLFGSSQRHPRIYLSRAVFLHMPRMPKAAKAMIDPATCQKLQGL